MTSQTPAIAIPLPRRPSGQRRRLFGLAGILTVAVAVAVAGGLWQAGRNGSTETAPPPAATVAQSTDAGPVESTPTYYLVGSPAEAAAVQATFEQLGVAPPLPEVVTVATTADADAFLRMMGEQDAIRDSLGLAPVTVVDLRTSSTASTAALGAQPLSDQEIHSRWLAELSGQQQANGIAEEAARWSAP